VKRESSSIDWFIYTALSYLGTPYIWGGDDPSGFDCSGYALECLKTVGLVNEDEDYTADGLFRKFSRFRVETAQRGALVFSLDQAGFAYHVAICLDEHFLIGAAGGDRRPQIFSRPGETALISRFV